MKRELLIFDIPDLQFIDFDFVPTAKIGGDIWTAKDVYFNLRGSKSHPASKYVVYDKNNTLFCNYEGAKWASGCIKGWHLPTKEEAENLVQSFIDSRCRYNIRRDNYNRIISMDCIGDDHGINLEFNGYYYRVSFVHDSPNKFWVESLADGGKLALWIENRIVPDKKFSLHECSPDAYYPLRLVKDK